jgi:regulation of enolase protein 1 (concanavalin A-like superfamily)
MVARRPRCRSNYWTAIIILGLGSSSLAADWQSTLTREPPGNFPELRPLRATYRFGWAGLTAATGEVHFTAPSEDTFQLDGTGQSIGFVRALWKLDANFRAIANSQTLRPIETQQTENYRQKKLVTRLTFTNKGVTGARTESRGESTATKTRKFNFTDLFDLHSAMLYLRSQPLTDGSVHRVVVYAATNAYLATVTVVGRDEISVRAGTYKAIKVDLRLDRVGKHLELQPHRKFRRATIWVSDDRDRILLRVEAQIFVGTVFAELQSVRFDGARH